MNFIINIFSEGSHESSSVDGNVTQSILQVHLVANLYFRAVTVVCCSARLQWSVLTPHCFSSRLLCVTSEPCCGARRAIHWCSSQNSSPTGISTSAVSLPLLLFVPAANNLEITFDLLFSLAFMAFSLTGLNLFCANCDILQ